MVYATYVYLSEHNTTSNHNVKGHIETSKSSIYENDNFHHDVRLF